MVNTPETLVFKEKFLTSAMNIQKEIQERIPEHAKTYGMSEIFFERPNSVDYIKALAFELERLANALAVRH